MAWWPLAATDGFSVGVKVGDYGFVVSTQARIDYRLSAGDGGHGCGSSTEPNDGSQRSNPDTRDGLRVTHLRF